MTTKFAGATNGTSYSAQLAFRGGHTNLTNGFPTIADAAASAASVPTEFGIPTDTWTKWLTDSGAQIRVFEVRAFAGRVLNVRGVSAQPDGWVFG